jgi:tetratricopeptide (TPR) repeat protein
MKPLISLVALAIGLLSPLVAAQSPVNPHAGEPAPDAALLPKQEMTPQFLYQFLLAEIAAQRGQFGLSAGAFLELARSTRDPRVVKRAAEVAFHARQFDNALEAIRIWLTIDPASQQARQMRATMLLASGRIEELAAILGKDFASEGERAGDALLQLSRAFTRYPDRAAIDRLFELLAAPFPRSPEAQLARAQAAMGAGNTEKAGAAIDRALQLRPDWEMAALLKAELMPKGQAQIDFLKSWLATNGGAQQARLGYARALVGEKRYEEARVEFRTLLAENPDNPEILYAVGILSLQVNAVADAEGPLRRYVELGRGDLNPPRFYLGQIAEQAERYDDAIRWYDQVDAGENLLTARIRAARALWKQNRLDQARERLAVARSINPGEMRLVIAEGQMLRDAGRHEEGFAFLDKALQAQPEQPDLLYEVALAAEKLGRLDIVERHLRRLIALKPDSPQGYNALGYTFADHNIRLDEAAELVDKALSLAPDDSFILDSKGWVLYRQGKLAAALETLQKAYAKQPDAEIAAHVGEVLWKLGRPDEAQAIWREAGKAFPKNEALTETIKRFVP